MALKPDQQKEAHSTMKALLLFAGCTDEQLTDLSSCMNAREAPSNKVVLMDQEIGKTLYILAKGKVGVWKRVGGEKQRLATLAAPNFFGERTMFEESPASALVKTDEPCSLFVLDRTDFDQAIQKFPAMKDLIHRNMKHVRELRLGPTPPPSTEPSH